MPPNRQPRCMKLLERHVEYGPQLRTTAGVWGRCAPKFLVSVPELRKLLTGAVLLSADGQT